MQLSPYILQGRFNNEFIRGRQHKRINPKELKIEDRPANTQIYTEKKVFNRLLPIYLTRYGILAQNMPIPGIVPISNTSKSVTDSIQVNKFILNYMADSDFKGKYNKAIKHSDIYGIAWFKTGIDWSAGDTIATLDSKIGDTSGKITVKEGRPFISFIPMYEVFVDNINAESMDEINELVHRRVFSTTYIRARYGFDAKEEGVTEARLSSYPQYTNLGLAAVGDAGYANVYEYYKKPDAVYPKGRYVITCNDKVIFDDVLPYLNGANGARVIPFDFFAMQTVPNYLIGVTVYSQLIPIQETYNAIKNRYLEYVNHIAIGQLYYWEGSLVNPNNFTTKPGKLVALKRNARQPTAVQKDKLSMEFINYLKAIEDDLLVTAGLSQMTAFGSSKSSVRTDGVVDKLSESDENKLSNAIDNISDCLIKVYKKLVYLEQERTSILLEKLKLAKKDDYALNYRLSEVDAEQITIVNRDFLMQSDQAFDKKLQQAGSLGLFAPDSNMSYQSKVELLNALHAGYLKDTLDPHERATHDLCDEENRTMFDKKTLPTVEGYHIHRLHIDEHNLFRISPEVRQLFKDDPVAHNVYQQMLDAHITKHQEFMSKSQDDYALKNAKAALSTTPRKGQGLN